VPSIVGLEGLAGILIRNKWRLGAPATPLGKRKHSNTSERKTACVVSSSKIGFEDVPGCVPSTRNQETPGNFRRLGMESPEKYVMRRRVSPMKLPTAFFRRRKRCHNKIRPSRLARLSEVCSLCLPTEMRSNAERDDKICFFCTRTAPKYFAKPDAIPAPAKSLIVFPPPPPPPPTVSTKALQPSSGSAKKGKGTNRPAILRGTNPCRRTRPRKRFANDVGIAAPLIEPPEKKARRIKTWLPTPKKAPNRAGQPSGCYKKSRPPKIFFDSRHSCPNGSSSPLDLVL